MASTENKIQMTPDIKPEDPAYIEAMAAKGETAVQRGNNGLPAPVAPKPEGVPDKFYNATTGEVDYAGLTKSYTELEKKFSQPKAKDEPAKPVEEPAKPTEADKPLEIKPDDGTSEEPNTDQKAAEDALEAKGLNLQDFSTEYSTKGELTPESYDKLEKSGIPKDVVDQYIAGQKALAEQVQLRAYAEVGGKSQYDQMTKWAATNMTAAELSVYNESVSGGSQEQINQAVRGLHDRYTQANGREPGRTVGGNNTNAGAKPFGSRAEMTDAMKNPKYEKDTAYRNDVIARIEASNIF